MCDSILTFQYTNNTSSDKKIFIKDKFFEEEDQNKKIDEYA